MPSRPSGEVSTGQPHMKIVAGLSVSRSLVSKMEKLLNDGVDVPLWIRAERNDPSKMSL